jgi:hypothetical protein
MLDMRVALPVDDEMVLSDHSALGPAKVRECEVYVGERFCRGANYDLERFVLPTSRKQFNAVLLLRRIFPADSFHPGYDPDSGLRDGELRQKRYQKDGCAESSMLEELSRHDAGLAQLCDTGSQDGQTQFPRKVGSSHVSASIVSASTFASAV